MQGNAAFIRRQTAHVGAPSSRQSSRPQPAGHVCMSTVAMPDQTMPTSMTAWTIHQAVMLMDRMVTSSWPAVNRATLPTAQHGR